MLQWESYFTIQSFWKRTPRSRSAVGRCDDVKVICQIYEWAITKQNHKNLYKMNTYKQIRRAVRPDFGETQEEQGSLYQLKINWKASEFFAMHFDFRKTWISLIVVWSSSEPVVMICRAASFVASSNWKVIPRYVNLLTELQKEK